MRGIGNSKRVMTEKAAMRAKEQSRIDETEGKHEG